MKKLARKKVPARRSGRAIRRADQEAVRKNRIEQLKSMINNEEYLSEAVTKLAKSLTTGLMK
jgi:hypothetical protein